VIASGYVRGADAVCLGGNNFVGIKMSTGLYTIIFTPPFAARPTVITSQVYNGDVAFGGGDTRDNSLVVAVTHDRVVIKTGDAANAAQDRNFTFIAIGPIAAGFLPASPEVLGGGSIVNAARAANGPEICASNFVVAGVADVTFIPAFAKVPVPVAGQCLNQPPSGQGGSTLDNAVIIGASVNKVRIAVGDGVGTKANRSFEFLVAGVLNGAMGISISTIIYGSVKSDGTIKTGNSPKFLFAVVKSGVGFYDVVFYTPFSKRPIVMANVTSAGNSDDVKAVPGSHLDNAVMVAITNMQFRVKTGNNLGAPTDQAFEFIAVGF